MSCPLPDMVRFKGRGSGGGSGSGLGAEREDSIGREGDSTSAVTGDDGCLWKQPQRQLHVIYQNNWLTQMIWAWIQQRSGTCCWSLIFACWGSRRPSERSRPGDPCCRSVPFPGCCRGCGRRSAPMSAGCAPWRSGWRLPPPPHPRPCCRCSCYVARGFWSAASPGPPPRGPGSNWPAEPAERPSCLCSDWALPGSTPAFGMKPWVSEEKKNRHLNYVLSNWWCLKVQHISKGQKGT